MKTGHHSRCQIIHDFFGLLCDEEIEASAVLVESSRHHSLWTHWVNLQILIQNFYDLRFFFSLQSLRNILGKYSIYLFFRL